MAVLPRYISAGNIPADGSLKGGGRSAVILDELEQNRFWLCWWCKMNCGLSGPWGRTVRLSKLKRAQKLGSFVLGVQNELRTVRSLGADGPPPTENSGTETLRFLCVLTF